MPSDNRRPSLRGCSQHSGKRFIRVSKRIFLFSVANVFDSLPGTRSIVSLRLVLS